VRLGSGLAPFEGFAGKLKKQTHSVSKSYAGLHVQAMSQKLLGGRYDILRQLGGGGFGQTYLAKDQHLPGKPYCVVKKLQPKIKRPEALDVAKRLFDAEAQVLHQLGHHDQIPRLTAHFEEGRQFYLVQEYVPGRVVSQVFKEDLPLAEDSTIGLLREILTLLIFVHHHQVIHRDIKPSNLILRESDGKIVLIDFGAVKQMTLSPIEESTVIVGSSGYAPPEQLTGHSCFESDLYAVGMIGIQALTSYSPKHLQRDPQTRVLFWRDQAEVSPEFAEVLDRLVQHNPNDRYGSAEEVLEALASLVPQEVPTSGGVMAWTERGDYLLQRQHFREAIVAYEKALDLQPEEAELWVKQGRAYEGVQQFSAARDAYQRATQYEPKNAQAWLKLGMLLENLSCLEESLLAYDQVLKLEPDNLWAWHDRGKIQEALCQWDASLAAYGRAIEIKPNFQLAVESRKRILLDQGRTKELVQWGHYSEALTLAKRDHQRNPTHSSTLLTYGTVLAKLQRSEEAIVILDQLLGSDLDYAAAWRVRGEVRSQRKDWSGALQDLERSLALMPDMAESWRMKAQVLEHLERREEALTAYTQALILQPADSESLAGRSRLVNLLCPTPVAEDFQLDGDDSTVLSIPVMSQSLPQVSVRPELKTVHSTAEKIARKLEGISAYQDALRAKESANLTPDKTPSLLSALVAEKRSPKLGTRTMDQTGSWLLRGPLLDKVRQHSRSIDALPNNASDNPEHPDNLKKRGDAMFGLGRYEDAIACYDRAIHIQPNNPKLWCSLASALMKLTRYREAIACFDRAIHLKPESHIPWYWRSRVLIELKRYPEALRSLEQALMNKPNFQPALRAHGPLKRFTEQQAS
jgi:tetratricopeptide (TPR) repeat protein